MFKLLRDPKTLLFLSFFCVFATYNSLDFSVYHWIAQGNWNTQWLYYGLVSIVLAGLWLFLLSSIKKACSTVGLIIVALILAGIGYIPYHTGYLTELTDTTLWLFQILLAFGLWGCSSWARIRRALNGQASVDTVDGDTIGIDH